MRTPLVAVFVAGIAAAAAAQQSPAADRPVISVETSMVLLPVTVVDRHGGFVPGLSRENFTVFDNGAPRTITFFANEDMAATVGLVIDASSSMTRQRERVAAAASAFAELSHPGNELFTIHFNEAVWNGLPPTVAFAESVEQLRAALARAPARGMTAMYDAVWQGLDHLAAFGTRDRKALVIVSDGGDNASLHTRDEVLDRARRTNVTMYAVILADPDDHDARPDVLRMLARDTGGDAVTPARLEDLVAGFTRIALEIRAGYTIGFLPPDLAGSEFRPTRVVVTSGARRPVTVRTRAGYYAGPSRRGD